MSRTSSQRLDFWQFEVALFNDMKMVDLNEKYGTLGEAVYFRILSYIADSEGYYAVLSDSLVLSIYRSIGSKWIKDKRVILRIIDYCGVCGLFDVNLLRQNVITSCGIQRRWLYAKEKARAKGFTTDKFWLLDGQSSYKCTQNQNKCSNNDDKCSNKADKCDNNTPYISQVKRSKETPNPLQGGGRNIWKDRFFEKHTIFEKKNYNDDGIDYEILYREFEKSTTLQKMWSFPKVVKLYSQIANGEFRDTLTEQQQILQGIDARANRERYFTAKRNQAETKAEYIRDSCCEKKPQIKAYAKELRRLDIEIAKAEVKQDKQLLEYLEGERCDYERKIEEALNEIGYTKSDLEVKYDCEKCQDTGWLPNGQACDCYKK